VVNSNTSTSLAGSANPINNSIAAGPNQGSLAYGNPGSASGGPQLLSNLVGVSRNVAPLINQTTTTCSRFTMCTPISTGAIWAASAMRPKDRAGFRPQATRGSTLEVRGQVKTMETSFYRLGLGMIFAVVLVYLLMAVNFQSWMDPFIILMALPGAMAGIVWMLFLTQTTFSVPSLMGSIMCIGVATANSILLVVFANDQRVEGLDARSAALSAGDTRIRPVIMTASAMIHRHAPHALGLGEGGEQNAPLGRAVIGVCYWRQSPRSLSSRWYIVSCARIRPSISNAGLSKKNTSISAMK